MKADQLLPKIWAFLFKCRETAIPTEENFLGWTLAIGMLGFFSNAETWSARNRQSYRETSEIYLSRWAVLRKIRDTDFPSEHDMETTAFF